MQFIFLFQVKKKTFIKIQTHIDLDEMFVLLCNGVLCRQITGRRNRILLRVLHVNFLLPIIFFIIFS